MTASAVRPDTAAAAPDLPAPARGSLLRAELRRLLSRRMVRVLVLLGLLGLLAGVFVASTQYATPDDAGLARAQERRQSIVAEQAGYREQCLREAQARGAAPGEQVCPPGLTVEELGPAEDYLAEQPFTMAGDGGNGVVGVAVATAALAFLIGATYVGAEWSTRSMVALLFWEPRRVRVMLTKTAVLAAAAALLGALAQGLWLLGARWLAATRGNGEPPGGLWGELSSSAGRGVLLVVLVALLGFGVANLLRGTAAAFGFGFVYFVVVENLVRVVRPAWQPYLLSDNALALVEPGGRSVSVPRDFVDENGVPATIAEVVLGNLHGAVVLGSATAVVLALGVVLFLRRDLD